MNKLIISFIFILFNYSINLNGHFLNVIPSFVGYWFLLKGAGELQEKHGHFEKCISWSKGMLIFSAIKWCALLIFALSGGIRSALQFAESLFTLIAIYQMLEALGAMEDNLQNDIGISKLRFAWILSIVLSFGISFLMIFPTAYNIGLIICFLANIYVVFCSYRSAQSYRRIAG